MNKANTIVNFMWYKHNLIFEKTGIVYFTEQDAQNIKKWNVFEINAVYEQLYNNINIRFDLLLFRGNMCPFCIKVKNENVKCEQCEYGANHGYCTRDNSVYTKIGNCLDFHTCFDTEEIQKDIEKIFKPKTNKAEIIIKFMKWKNDIILKVSDVPYCVEQDYQAIRDWDVADINFVYDKLKKLQRVWATGDGRHCPFCIESIKINVKHGPVIGFSCSHCSYYQRHGKCGKENSTYIKIIDAINGHEYKHYDDITSFIGKERIKNKITELFI